jgi:hypothetical protein
MSGDPFGSWPKVARFYLIGVAVLGAAVTGYALSRTDGSHSVVFAALLCLSLVGSVGRIVLPIPGHGNSLALSALVDYIALIACGPSAAVLVAAWSGWTESGLGSERKTPVHAVVFSVASAAVAMSIAGVMFAMIDRQPPLWNNGPRVEAFAAGATVFFFCTRGSLRSPGRCRGAVDRAGLAGIVFRELAEPLDWRGARSGHRRHP